MSVPLLVSALEDVSVTQISAGCEHSAVVLSDGRLCTFGQGEGGRLGHGDNAYVILYVIFICDFYMCISHNTMQACIIRNILKLYLLIKFIL